MKDDLKKRAAQKAVECVRSGQIVGLGTGSTAYYAIKELGQLARSGWDIKGVPTSNATARLAAEEGIDLVDMNEVDRIDIIIDGADEVNESLQMIKGGGGALSREKLVALGSRRRIYIVDDSKLVSRLGERCDVPVEVLPFAWRQTLGFLLLLGCTGRLRRTEGGIFESDNGNYIIDCRFPSIEDANGLEAEIKRVPGVIESGIFVGLADAVVIAYVDRIEVKGAGWPGEAP